MKIVYDYQIFATGPYGGISRYFVELASELNRYPDTKVRVVAPLIQSRLLAQYRKQFPTFGIDISSRQFLPTSFVREAAALLFGVYGTFASPDIVHETYYSTKRTAPKNSKIVMTFHDAIPERLPKIFPGFAKDMRMKRSSLDRSDHIICVSNSTRRDLIDIYDVNPAKISVVSLASSLRSSILDPINIGTPYFLHVGGRYPYKNFIRLIEAFGKTMLYRTHSLISFSGHALSSTETEAMKRAGVPEDRVKVASGDDTLLARYYAGAEALVFPSMYEGFGIPLLEAMECNCPVITSDCSSLPEVAGDAALYCNPTDIDSIAGCLVQIASSQETKDRLISRGRLRAKQFSWSRCAAETYSIYRGLLSQSLKGAF